jgi:L-2-hydroxycarboxylate dehydrogenase (NAD+)
MAKIRISVQDITDLAAKALLNNGISEEDAIIIIAHLFDGELSGHPSHGFFRIPGIVNAAKKAPYPDEIKITKETAFSALLDGGMRQGLVVALDSTNIAIKKAKETKLAIVAGHNYVGTTGAMGYFTRKIADNGLIGVMIATSAEGVSPWGGTEMILGTNPISISIPRNGDPIVGDLATAAWSYGDLALAMLEGRHVPEGIVIDKDGNPSTNPHDADNGSQLPMAQHKGYVLGLAVEILAGPLIGAKAGVKAVKASDGFTMLALSPDVFVSADQFKTQVNALIDEIKSSQRRPGVDEILYPGEHSQKTRLANKNSEYIEILDQVVENVRTLAEVK